MEDRKNRGFSHVIRVYYRFFSILSLLEQEKKKKRTEQVMVVSDAEEKTNSANYLSKYPVSRLSPAFDLIDLAREVAKADDFLSVQTEGKLKILADQIRSLQQQAKRVLEEAKWNQELHRAECSFQKKVGATYHFYKKNDDVLICSMLSPQDWKGQPPHAFLGSYRLDNDMGWKELTDESHDSSS